MTGLYYFWAIVGCLAVAAACNHGWHHARDAHLRSRLTRASARNHGTSPLLRETADGRTDDDVDAATPA